MKVLCYGVRDVEKPFFENINKDFGYELTCIPELLDDNSVLKAEGHEAVILRANCPANRKNLEIYKKFGVKYVLTRTVGYAHIDLEAAKELGLKVAYVPFYSPNAISELAVTLALMLARHIAYTVNNTRQNNFIIDRFMFSKEIRNSTVGIIGLGKIGFTTAQLFKGLGANILGYDIFQKEDSGDVLTQVDLDELLSKSDIVSIHVPFIPGVNKHMINEDFLSKMKDGSILINTSRGEIQDINAIIKALETNKLQAFGTDVLENESSYFLKNFSDKSVDPVMQKLADLYPRVLVTPHMGSYTDEAVSNMVEISYNNLKQFIDTDKCDNEI